MKDDTEPTLTPIDAIASGNNLQIMKALIPYINPASQMPLAFLIKFLEIQNLRTFFQETGPLTAQGFSDSPASPMEIFSEIIPYFPTAVKEQLSQGMQMMEMLNSFETCQSMFSQMEPEKED